MPQNVQFLPQSGPKKFVHFVLKIVSKKFFGIFLEKRDIITRLK